MGMPASSLAGGMCVAMAPDVCKVPAPPSSPIPVPFPNMSQVAMVTNPCTKVMIQNMPTVPEDGKMPMSEGDEGGVAGGVVSGTFMQQVAFKMGSSKVKVGGKALAILMSSTGHNGSSPNAPMGSQAVPSQMVVLAAP